MLISKRNKRAVLFLAGILLVIIYSPRILAKLNQGDSLEITFEELDKQDQELRLSKNEPSDRGNVRASKYKIPESSFDPNTYSIQDWMKLGLSEKQADVVLRFTKYGVQSNEELKKIFVIPEELYELIKDSTFYPIAVRTNSVEARSIEVKQPQLIDINSATQKELMSLKGIGEYYAKKIIEYRDKLGGFVNKEQLLEVWKFTPDKLSEIESEIVVSGKTVQLDVNFATYDEFIKHPYISYKVANSIVKMREQRGGFQEKTEIMESKLIDRELYNKLEPYIKL